MDKMKENCKFWSPGERERERGRVRETENLENETHTFLCGLRYKQII